MKKVKNLKFQKNNYFIYFSIFIIFALIFILFYKLFGNFEGNDSTQTSKTTNPPKLNRYNCDKGTYFNRFWWRTCLKRDISGNCIKHSKYCSEKDISGNCKQYSPYCVNGESIKTPIENPCPNGEYPINWNGKNRTNGPRIICSKMYYNTSTNSPVMSTTPYISTNSPNITESILNEILESE